MTTAQWLEPHLAGAPAALRERILVLAAPVSTRTDLVRALSEAGRGTLETVIAGDGNRSAALDLLAADALITLALLAQAELDPERLGEWPGSGGIEAATA
jgi:uncharacterized membrane protein